MILIRVNLLLGRLEGVGPNGTRYPRCHFRAQKCLDFQGPPLPMALEMDLPPSKSLRPAPYKQTGKLIDILIILSS
jgi:hypothetical protein